MMHNSPFVFFVFFMSFLVKNVDLYAVKESSKNSSNKISISEILFKRAQEGDIDGFRRLLDKETSLNAQDEKGDTILLKVSGLNKGSVKKEAINKMLRMLIKRGATVNVSNKKGVTPLHNVALRGNLVAVKLFLKEGALVNVSGAIGVDWKGDSPLHWSILNRYVDVAKCLLKKGADIASNKDEGWTPLHVGARCNDKRIIKHLVKKGANLFVPNKDGDTPWDFLNSDEELVALASLFPFKLSMHRTLEYRFFKSILKVFGEFLKSSLESVDEGSKVSEERLLGDKAYDSLTDIKKKYLISIIKKCIMLLFSGIQTLKEDLNVQKKLGFVQQELSIFDKFFTSKSFFINHLRTYNYDRAVSVGYFLTNLKKIHDKVQERKYVPLPSKTIELNFNMTPSKFGFRDIKIYCY